MQLRPMRTREAHEGEDIGFGVVHEGGELEETRAKWVGDMPPGDHAGGVIFLREDGAYRGLPGDMGAWE
jgi:hypothetical protein